MRAERSCGSLAADSGWHGSEHNMATPNYQFEKRRKEMDKKARKEEKRLRKLEAAAAPITAEPAAPAIPGQPT